MQEEGDDEATFEENPLNVEFVNTRSFAEMLPGPTRFSHEKTKALVEVMELRMVMLTKPSYPSRVNRWLPKSNGEASTMSNAG